MIIKAVKTMIFKTMSTKKSKDKKNNEDDETDEKILKKCKGKRRKQ